MSQRITQRKITYHCVQCGSADIARRAAASWSEADQEWQLQSLTDGFSCGHCGLDSDKPPREEIEQVPRPNYGDFVSALANWKARVRALKAITGDFATPDEIESARAKHGSDKVTIDDDAIASRTDEGLWVQAWVYIDTEPA